MTREPRLLAAIDLALHDGLRFLSRVQLASGELPVRAFRDPALTGPGEPDGSIFATTFCLHALGQLRSAGIAVPHDLVLRARRFLLAEMSGPGLFSYYPRAHPSQLPPDTDDTCCASAVLRTAHPFVLWGENIESLLRSRNRAGAFLTWIEPFAGPNNVDVGVNANVLLYLGDRPETQAASAYIDRVLRQGDPLDDAIYYPNRLVLAYLVWRAHRAGAGSLSSALVAAGAGVAAAQRTDGSFEDDLGTACAIAVLAGRRTGRDTVRAAVELLLARRRQDGAWSPGTVYRSRDEYFGSEALTTALCLEALVTYGRALAGGHAQVVHGRAPPRTMAAPQGVTEPPRASLAGYLAPLAGSLLDPKLVSRAAWSRCLAVADAVPGDAAFGMPGFELRLGDDPDVDILVCAFRAAGGPRWLRGMAEQRASGQGADPWGAISAIARSWDGGRLADLLDCVWLEFDSSARPPRSAGELPVPSVFCSTRPTDARAGAAAPDLTAATGMLEVLLAARLIPSWARALTEVELALPEGSKILQVGAMLSRSPPLVRVCVHGPGPDAVRQLLGRLGWSGPADEVERVLVGVGEGPRSVCLDLDLGPGGIGGTVGIELYADEPDEPADATRWRLLLERFEQLKLITPVKRAALATYPRAQVAEGLMDRLPRQYAQATALLAAQRTGRFVAHLHHVKVAVSRHRPPTAKAYLGVWHQWS
jgi:hypothetical protein